MDAATASVVTVGIVGVSAPVTAAIVKLVRPRSRRLDGNGVGYCDRIGPLEGRVGTAEALSEERQRMILERLDRIEAKLDNR